MRRFRYLFATFVLLKTGAVPALAQRFDTLTLHFAFNSYLIRPADTPAFNVFLDRKAKTGDSLFIIGYADPVGTADYNRRLSFFRAMSAARYSNRLISLPSKLVARGKDGLIPGDDSLNRRVQFIVHRWGGNIDTVKAGHSDVSGRPAGSPTDTTLDFGLIYFVENSPVLTPESRMALPGYIRSLKRFGNRYLEIDGYCNSPGSRIKPGDPLFELSIQRARTIYESFIDEGFDSARVSYKGLGNISPVYSKPEDLQQARANMRVEIRVFTNDPRNNAHD